MNEEARHHHSDGEEFGSYPHRGRYVMPPVAAAAAVLTVARSAAVIYALGAVVFWVLAVLASSVSAMHDWRVCPLCSAPPKRLATAEARARLARRVHSRMRSALIFLLLTAVLTHALLPKPYMNTWEAKAAGAVVYVAVFCSLSRAFTTDVVHKVHNSECHLEWCRAGLRHAPNKHTARRRRAIWIGHYGIWIILILAPATCMVGLLSLHYKNRDLVFGHVFLLLLLTMVILDVCVSHTDIPCLRCARSLPDNGGEAAQRRMRWLRLFHVTRVPALGGAVLLLLASWVLSGSVAAKILVCVASLVVVYWAVLERVHSPVKPWCPWCKDDGGDDVSTDVPDPADNVPTPA